jgi:alpha-L-arabinofuranosidase
MVNEFGLMFDYERDPKMTRQPKYYVYPIWARFGDRILPANSSADPARELSVYAGRAGAGTVSVLVINKSERPADVQITLNGVRRITDGRVDSLTATSADATAAAFNGVADPKDDLSDAPSLPLKGSPTGRLSYTFAPYSITLLRLSVQ